MKIIIISGSTYAIPSIHFFCGQQMLGAVVSFGDLNKNNILVAHTAQHLGLPFKRFLKNQLLTDFKKWLGEQQADMVLVFGCRYKIPVELFTIPRLGFYNIHFSLLPAYRGIQPIFWQLANGENTGGVTMHQMAKEYDSGAVLVQQEIAILPGENHGLYAGRLSMESVQVIAKGIEKLNEAGDNLLYQQNEDLVSVAPAVSVNDLRIKWETQSAKEIENLVNAANPDYEGAITLFRGQLLRILEVNVVQLDSPVVYSVGSIVHADTNYGIFAACLNNQFLRLNIIQSPEGIFSGIKFASLGITAGERFESAADLSANSIKL